jgi:crossover junction endodeoxyribonuclease RuvC
MIVLGIDPGIAIVGYGVIECINDKYKSLEYGVIVTDKDLDTAERLKNIAIDLRCLINKYQPEEIALEELFYHSNQKTVISVAEARGVIILTAIESTAKLFEYTPLQVKQAITGFGNADKKQIQQMVKILLKLDFIPKPDDAADALAIALCHCQSKKINSLYTRK